MAQEAIKIAIIMEGGLIQEVLSAGLPVEYVIIDYDTEGGDPENVRLVPQLNADPVEAYVTRGDAETGYGQHVLDLFDAANG